LAAMLIFVGFRLAHPREFKQMYHIGIDQLIIFVATIITTLATDLLIGVGTGMAMEIIVNFIHGMSVKSIFKSDYTVNNISENAIQIDVKSELVFTNCFGFKEKLNLLPKQKQITIQLTEAKLIDHSSIVSLEEFKKNYEPIGGKVMILGHDKHNTVSQHPLATRKKKMSV